MKEMLELDIRLINTQIEIHEEQLERFKNEEYSNLSIGYVEGRLDGARQQKKILEQYLKEVDDG